MGIKKLNTNGVRAYLIECAIDVVIIVLVTVLILYVGTSVIQDKYCHPDTQVVCVKK